MYFDYGNTHRIFARQEGPSLSSEGFFLSFFKKSDFYKITKYLLL